MPRREKHAQVRSAAFVGPTPPREDEVEQFEGGFRTGAEPEKFRRDLRVVPDIRTFEGGLQVVNHTLGKLKVTFALWPARE